MAEEIFNGNMLTRAQLAARLNITYAKVRVLERHGAPHIVVDQGKRKKDVRFDFIEVLQWLRERQEERERERTARRNGAHE